MLIRPLPGVNREHLHRTLIEVCTEASNAHGRGGLVVDRHQHYIEWADRAVFQLWRLVSPDDLDRLIRTRAYWALLAPATTVGSGVVALVERELAERVKAFEDVCRTVDEAIQRWSRPGVFVVADTSFYIRHPEKLEAVDLAAVLEVRHEPVHLLLPMVVVDELDGLKQHSDGQVRWRARYTLAVLDRAFSTGSAVAQLRPTDPSALASGRIPRGEITVEIVFDPPGHTRLLINDDEIIDRTLAIEALAGRPVTMLTYDTGQSGRARAAGLRPHKLADPPDGEEPPPRLGRAARRR